MFKILIIVCPLIFVASFIDAVAGGGGLISLPAYLLAGLPPHNAMATNKVVSPIGSLIATIDYLRKGKINLLVGGVAAVGAITGATIGSNLVLLMSAKLLSTIILVSLPVVAVFIFTQKNLGSDDSIPKEMSRGSKIVFGFLVGLVLGFYDGMVGPGTGTFMIIAFAKIFRYDLVTSSGCAKLANLASNVGSAIVFILAGKVLWAVAIPAAVCSLAGGHFGAAYAIKGGSKNVRKVIFVVLGLLFVKFIAELV